MTTIPFEFDTEHGKFADALVFSDDVPSDEEIEAMKQQRLRNWIDAVVEIANSNLE
jgi:hypothetical protein